jgi:malate synthase
MAASVRNANAIRTHASFWRFLSTVKAGGIEIDEGLFNLVNTQVAPGTGVETDHFWKSLDTILTDMVPKNKELLAERDVIQEKLNDYHKENGSSFEMEDYKKFLLEIGYLVPEGADFQVSTSNVDPEIGQLAGPQLVVPVDNARYCLNAANARWVSLLDALYGTDVIPESPGAEIGSSYNPARGAEVFAHCEQLLDEFFPLTSGSYSQVTEFKVDNGALVLELENGTQAALANTRHFAGYQQGGSVEGVLFKSNGLHVEVKLDRDHPVGKSHRAGMYALLF